jgi:hypothetical protein
MRSQAGIAAPTITQLPFSIYAFKKSILPPQNCVFDTVDLDDINACRH